MEYMLRVTLERSDLVLLLEVIQADGACGFILVHHWVEVLTGQRLRNLLQLLLKLSFTVPELVPFEDGVR